MGRPTASIPRPPGATPLPGTPRPHAAPPPGAPPPGSAPPQARARDPFGLGGGRSPAAPAVVVDDSFPEAGGAEEISLDVAPAGRAAPPGQAPRPVPAPSGDGGEAQLREALSKASREVIEKIAWEVVPQLAETIIRQELDRLIKEREGR